MTSYSVINAVEQLRRLVGQEKNIVLLYKQLYPTAVNPELFENVVNQAFNKIASEITAAKTALRQAVENEIQAQEAARHTPE